MSCVNCEPKSRMIICSVMGNGTKGRDWGKAKLLVALLAKGRSVLWLGISARLWTARVLWRSGVSFCNSQRRLDQSDGSYCGGQTRRIFGTQARWTTRLANDLARLEQ